MVQNIAENEEAFILLNKEINYSHLMSDLSLKTKGYVCGFFFLSRRAGISQVATKG